MILWLEDRQDTALGYVQALKESGLGYFMVGTIEEFVTLLEDGVETAGLVFVIDIMLPGVNDLNGIGIPNALTGSGNRAGQVFVDRYIRAPNAKFRDRPVLFLTERTVERDLCAELQRLSAGGAGPVAILQKYDNDDLKRFVPKLREFQEHAASETSAPRRKR